MEKIKNKKFTRWLREKHNITYKIGFGSFRQYEKFDRFVGHEQISYLAIIWISKNGYSLKIFEDSIEISKGDFVFTSKLSIFDDPLKKFLEIIDKKVI